MKRKLVFAAIILSFAIVHVIAWQKLENVRRQTSLSAVLGISEGD
jgi:hypothetical protein